LIVQFNFHLNDRWLNNNQLSGTIPIQFGSFTNLKEL